MINVYINKEISCPISKKEIKGQLSIFLKKEGITTDTDVSVAIVGTTKMISLAEKYLKEKNGIHNVLSFPYAEGGDFIYPPQKVTHLGDIIICYPKVQEEAKSERVSVSVRAMELICHGALHLMGKHHE